MKRAAYRCAATAHLHEKQRMEQPSDRTALIAAGSAQPQGPCCTAQSRSTQASWSWRTSTATRCATSAPASCPSPDWPRTLRRCTGSRQPHAWLCHSIRGAAAVPAAHCRCTELPAKAAECHQECSSNSLTSRSQPAQAPSSLTSLDVSRWTVWEPSMWQSPVANPATPLAIVLQGITSLRHLSCPVRTARRSQHAPASNVLYRDGAG